MMNLKIGTFAYNGVLSNYVMIRLVKKNIKTLLTPLAIMAFYSAISQLGSGDMVPPLQWIPLGSLVIRAMR